MDVSRLNEAISYNPKSGVFVWLKTNSNRSVAGTKAGHVSATTGYRYIKIDGKFFPASRIAWAIMTGEFPEEIVDHVNCIRDDDRWENLRLADRSENAANSKIHRDNSSGFKGIEFHAQTGKWRARICKQGMRVSLGLFCSREDAHAAYVLAATKIFGEHARAR